MSCCGKSKGKNKANALDGQLEQQPNSNAYKFITRLGDGESTEKEIVLEDFNLRTGEKTGASRKVNKVTARRYYRNIFLAPNEDGEYKYVGQSTVISLLDERFGFCENLCVHNNKPKFKLEIVNGRPVIVKKEEDAKAE